MDLVCVAMMTPVMMIIGGVMLMMMTTMTMPEIMTVTMMMTVVVLVLVFLNIQVRVSRFNLFACLITAFPKKSIMELIINLLWKSRKGLNLWQVIPALRLISKLSSISKTTGQSVSPITGDHKILQQTKDYVIFFFSQFKKPTIFWYQSCFHGGWIFLTTNKKATIYTSTATDVLRDTHTHAY